MITIRTWPALRTVSIEKMSMRPVRFANAWQSFSSEPGMRALLFILMLPAVPAAGVGDEPAAPRIRNPKLRAELLRRIEPDQKARLELIKWMKQNRPPGGGNVRLQGAKLAEFAKLAGRLRKIDADNTKWLKAVVDKHGWPAKSLVGADGARAAWLLVQHADADRKFQRRCLDLMTALPKGEVSRANVAYLTDRVLLAEGKKQKYGTQFHQVNGKWKPKPLQDPENVDKLRAEAGLPPLAKYAELIRRQQSPEKAKPKPAAKP